MSLGLICEKKSDELELDDSLVEDDTLRRFVKLHLLCKVWNVIFKIANTLSWTGNKKATFLVGKSGLYQKCPTDKKDKFFAIHLRI